MSYLLTNLNNINPFVKILIDNALDHANLATHSDQNALHLHTDQDGDIDCVYEDQIRNAVKALMSYVPTKTACVVFTPGHEDEKVTGRFLRSGSSLGFDLTVIAKDPVDISAMYRLIFQYDKTDAEGSTANARMFLMHVPRYPNRLECYNELFNLYISDVANKWGVVLDPNNNYGIKLLDSDTGKPLNRDQYERFVNAQATSRIVRRAICGGRSSRFASNNCHIFELVCEGSGRKIVNFTFHVKEGEPYVTVG